MISLKKQNLVQNSSKTLHESGFFIKFFNKAPFGVSFVKTKY